MCDHCRSATVRMPNGGTTRTTVQKKASALATSSHENDGSVGASCGQWKKSCCGGGCCGSATSKKPCCGSDQDDGRQAARITRQFRRATNSRSVYGHENHDDSSGYLPQRDTSCGSGCENSRNKTVSSFVTGPPIMETGVCPAMMRNLPCTPLPKPKCFGGDCRDEDTDSEHSREI